MHKYNISVEPVDEAGDLIPVVPLNFRVRMHDDLLEIIDRVSTWPEFTPELAKTYVVGLKLFAETVRANKDKPIFDELMPHLAEIIRISKNPCAKKHP